MHGLMIARPWGHCDANKFQRPGPNVSILELCADRNVDGYAWDQACDFLFCCVSPPNLPKTFEYIPKLGHVP